jgi:hypothetical protein
VIFGQDSKATPMAERRLLTNGEPPAKKKKEPQCKPHTLENNQVK